VPETDAGEKTEQPTPRRRQEARQEGQVPRSTDLTAAVVILAALGLLNILGPQMLSRLLDLTRDIGRLSDTDSASLLVWIRRTIYGSVVLLAPFLLLLFTISLAGAIAQTGPLLAWKKLQPQLSHVSPLKGIKRLFSLDALTRTGFGLLKMSMVAAVAYWSLVGQIQPVLGVGSAEAGGIFAYSVTLVFMLSLRMALVLLILGLLDYFYQRWRIEQKLRMSKQEIKDELKKMDGDPLLKSRRRQAQMKLAAQRLRIEVPKADVVVTNPTEYAVALRYDEQTMGAPRIVAKGVDYMAMQIRHIAQQNGVPIMQRPPLARGLYAAAEVGDEVPPMYYKVVAELLAYVYQLSNKAAG
jgi:flagellar biosynthetic protein FlhB